MTKALTKLPHLEAAEVDNERFSHDATAFGDFLFAMTLQFQDI